MVIVTGKGNRRRSRPLESRTMASIDRDLRARSQHPGAASDALWLGLKKGKGRAGPKNPSGVLQMLERRSKQAGVTKVHPHQFRHTFSHNWRRVDPTTI